MTVDELVEAIGHRASAVPDRLQGCFRRRSIVFADGREDVTTRVVWLQAGAISFDIRIPCDEADLETDRPPAERSASALLALARREGGVSTARWDGTTMDWAPWTGLQTQDLWPEPGILRRVGPCMIEFAPSGAYVEDWRFEPGSADRLLALALVEERDLDTGSVLHRGGGLVVCGNHAGFVRGRAEAAMPGLLRDLLIRHRADPEQLAKLLAVDVVYGTRPATGAPYTTILSVDPQRLGQPILDMQNFTVHGERIHQLAQEQGRSLERIFQLRSA